MSIEKNISHDYILLAVKLWKNITNHASIVCDGHSLNAFLCHHLNLSFCRYAIISSKAKIITQSLYIIQCDIFPWVRKIWLSNLQILSCYISVMTHLFISVKLSGVIVKILLINPRFVQLIGLLIIPQSCHKEFALMTFHTWDVTWLMASLLRKLVIEKGISWNFVLYITVWGHKLFQAN